MHRSSFSLSEWGGGLNLAKIQFFRGGMFLDAYIFLIFFLAFFPLPPLLRSVNP